MHVLAVHGGPGVKLPDRKLSLLRRALPCPVSTYTQTRSDLSTLIRELDTRVQRLQRTSGRVVLLGRSWGAALALQYALLHPSEVAGVVLIALAPMRVSRARVEECRAAVPLLRRRNVLALEAWERGSPPNPSLTPPQRRVRAHTQARFCARRFFDMYQRLTPTALQKVRVPVLIVQGDHDHAAFARRIAGQLPSAKLVLVKDCDHSVPDEQEALLLAKFVQALKF